jgi:hypothetical protein
LQKFSNNFWGDPVFGNPIELKFVKYSCSDDHLCGLVVRVLAADPEVTGSIPSATRFF